MRDLLFISLIGALVTSTTTQGRDGSLADIEDESLSSSQPSQPQLKTAPQPQRPNSQPEVVSSQPSSGRRLTYDLGGSFGSSQGNSFYELQVGLNYFLKDWLFWRNAAFYRTVSSGSGFLGWDTSAIAQAPLKINSTTQLTPSGGVGYRFQTNGQHAPFVEAGLGFRTAGIGANISVKHIMNRTVKKSRNNDTIVGISFGGSGQL